MTSRQTFHITDRTGTVLYTNLTKHTRVEGYGWQHLPGNTGGFLLACEIRREGWTVKPGAGV